MNVIYVSDIMLPLTKNIFTQKNINTNLYSRNSIRGYLVNIRFIRRAMIRILRKNFRAIINPLLKG